MNGSNTGIAVAGATRGLPSKPRNEDRVLVLGEVMEGGVRAGSTPGAVVFVADGVGGGPCGDWAARRVLEEVRDQISLEDGVDPRQVEAVLSDVNARIIEEARASPETAGSASTLVGLLWVPPAFCFVNAGDSEAWLCRDGRMFPVSTSDNLEGGAENVVTSYFGGLSNALRLSVETELREIRPEDTVLLCSDGLFKALKTKEVREVLDSTQDVEQVVRQIMDLVEARGQVDDVSVIVARLNRASEGLQ